MNDNKLENSIYITHGKMANGPTLYSIIKNEMFFLPAFLAHYRAIGIKQFLILDDNSDDGSRDYLVEQDDCVVMAADYSFGELVDEKISGVKGMKRAGILYKSVIPAKYLDQEYCIYVDADEFLLLPPGVNDITQLFDMLSEYEILSVAASQVEMYPERLFPGSHDSVPCTLKDLLAESPFFDSVSLVVLKKGKFPVKAGSSVTDRILRKYGIGYSGILYKFVPPAIYRKLFRIEAKSSVYKTPIFRQSDNVRVVGSHDTTIPPSNRILLSLLHFKFTSDFMRRVMQAVELKSHAGNSRKYGYYESLYIAMAKGGDGFMWEKSRRLKSADDLADAGLLYNRLPVQVK